MSEALRLEDRRTGREAVELPWPAIARAKRLMRRGLDLHETALALGVRPRDLDVSLWNHIAGESW